MDFETYNQYQEEWHEVLFTWTSEFENFCGKVNQVNEEWASVPFDVSMLTNEEKELMEEYQPDMSMVDTAYDFRREVQHKIECKYGYDAETRTQEYINCAIAL